MIITISFEYDTDERAARVLSSQPSGQPQPTLLPQSPSSAGVLRSVLFDGHSLDNAKKALRQAVAAAIRGDLPAITAARAR